MSVRQPLALISIIVLLAVAYVASKWGLADLYAKQARSKIERWYNDSASPEFQEWSAVLESIALAHQWDPRNPDFAEDLGRVYSWGTASKHNPGTIAFQQQALAYFRLVTRQTPTSPYAWSKVGLAKLRVGQIDSELFHAMKMAAMLGPWEPQVQAELVDVGLGTWTVLPDEIRNLVRETIERGMKYQASRMLRIAQRHGQVRVLCDMKVADKTLPLEACTH